MNNYYISTLIKELRNSHKYTIQKVASTLGVSKSAVSKWENGDDIKTEHLYELAKLYNVSFSELYYGKLNNEGNSEYWRRNYNLSNFELEDEINNKNVDNLKLLFEHCIMVKSRFFDLLPKWAKEELSNNELEEFEFIKQYFKFDINYYAYIKYGANHIGIANEKDKKETINNINALDVNRYKWELTKLYDFTYNYQSEAICKSSNLKALEYMLMAFSQIEKDSILYANLHVKEEKEEASPFGGKSVSQKERKITEEEIEHIPFFKVIINSGANVLYQYNTLGNVWNEKAFMKKEGISKKVDNNIYQKNQFYNFGGKTNVSILNNWKLFTYDDYLEFIDKNKTEHLKDIVNLKDSNPKKYFSNYKNRFGL